MVKASQSLTKPVKLTKDCGKIINLYRPNNQTKKVLSMILNYHLRLQGCKVNRSQKSSIYLTKVQLILSKAKLVKLIKLWVLLISRSLLQQETYGMLIHKIISYKLDRVLMGFILGSILENQVQEMKQLRESEEYKENGEFMKEKCHGNLQHLEELFGQMVFHTLVNSKMEQFIQISSEALSELRMGQSQK